MKRFISMLLALCMAVSVFTGMTLTASAESGAISEINIYGVPSLEENIVFSADEITVPEDAGYVLSSVSLYKNGEEYEGILDAGNYELYIEVEPSEGYDFAEDVEVLINGEPADSPWYVYGGFDLVSVGAEFSFGVEHICEVELGGIPDIEIGDTIAEPEIIIPDDANYSVTTSWVDENEEAVEGKFESGKRYCLEIYAEADDGYDFDGDFIETVIESESGDYVDYYITFESYTSITVHIEYSFFTEINEVEINGVPEAVAGEDITTDGITIPDDAPYELSDVYWYNVTDEENAEGKFEEGKRYELFIGIIPSEGYEFGEDVTVTVNGEDFDEFFWGSTYVDIYVEASFLQTIDKVELSGVPEGVLGEAVDINDITVPDDAKYEIVYVNLFESLDATYDVSEFEDGKKYYLYVEIDPFDGYEFADDVEVTVNGVKTNDFYSSSSYIDLQMEFSFLHPIAKVEFPAYPEAEAGDEAESYMPESDEDAPYNIYGLWVDTSSEDSGSFFTGTFEDETLYMYVYIAVASESYEFTSDTVITAGGETVYGLLPFELFGGGIIAAGKNYGFGLEAVENIELTIPEPEIGKEPVGAEDVEISESAGYTIEYVEWSVSSDNDDYNSDAMEGSFEEGKYYFVTVSLSANDGYYLSSDLTITVNGETVELDSENHFMLGNTFALLVPFGKLETEEIPTDDPTDIPENGDNPGTGDNTSAVFVTAIILLAAAVTVLLRRREER